MRRIELFSVVLGSTLLLSSCLDSGNPDEEPDTPPANTSSSSTGSDGTMSFPDALKLKRSLSREEENLKEELAQAEEIIEAEKTAMQELEELRAYEARLKTAQEEIEASLNYWREATRASFVGVQLPEIVTVSGEVYRAVTIRGVSDDTLEIGYEGGTAALEITNLPPGLRKNLIHEPTVLAEIE